MAVLDHQGLVTQTILFNVQSATMNKAEWTNTENHKRIEVSLFWKFIFCNGCILFLRCSQGFLVFFAIFLRQNNFYLLME